MGITPVVAVARAVQYGDLTVIATSPGDQPMKHAEVREVHDHATRYLASEDVVAVERDGSVVGYYIPVAPRRDSRYHTLTSERGRTAMGWSG